MGNFAYQVRDSNGKLDSGVLSAASQDEAGRLLREQGKFIIKLVESSKAAKGSSEEKAQKKKSNDVARTSAAKRVKRKDVIFFAHQLSVMVETGVPITEALVCTSSQIENKHFRVVLNDITDAVQGGQDLSSALARYPTVFPTVMRSLVHAGELSGTMPMLIEKAAGYMVKEQQTMQKLKSALTYPTIMLTMAVTITVFLMIFVLPKFAGIYASRGAALPTPTRVLLAMSSALTNYWQWWIVGLVAMFFFVGFLLKTNAGNKVVDYFKLNCPVLKTLFLQAYLSRSCRTMGTMLGAGVAMLDTVAIVKMVVRNQYFQELWEQVDSDLRRGAQLSDTLMDSDLVPPSISQMIRSGEKSGRLGNVIERVADYAESEFDDAVETSTQYIEPIMIVAMGSLVGFVAISLLMPIFSAGHVASGG